MASMVSWLRSSLTRCRTEPTNTPPLTRNCFSAASRRVRCHRKLGQSGGNERAWKRSEEHTSELQSRFDLVCRLLLEKKKGQARALRLGGGEDRRRLSLAGRLRRGDRRSPRFRPGRQRRGRERGETARH